MSLDKDNKTKITKEFRIHPKDTGSSDVQVALLTARINEITKHLQVHIKDHHSRRGLLKLVGRRRKLLDYLKETNPERYQNVLQKLDLRK
jgi:small subunit ribosomal protein S15